MLRERRQLESETVTTKPKPLSEADRKRWMARSPKKSAAGTEEMRVRKLILAYSGTSLAVLTVVYALFNSFPQKVLNVFTGGSEVDIAEGIVRSGDASNARHELVTSAPRGWDSYFVKVIASDGSVAKAFFIHGGSTFHTLVPPGAYAIRYASGRAWRGEAKLFGSWTTTMEYDKPLVFEQNEDGYGGYKVILGAPVDGKPAVHPIPVKSF
jgi:hypothetical protein